MSPTLRIAPSRRKECDKRVKWLICCFAGGNVNDLTKGIEGQLYIRYVDIGSFLHAGLSDYVLGVYATVGKDSNDHLLLCQKVGSELEPKVVG